MFGLFRQESNGRRSIRNPWEQAIRTESLEPRVLLSGQIFVANLGSGTIGEYTTSGAVVNASLVSGLTEPNALAISGSDLFVTSDILNRVGQYNTSGATLSDPLISELDAPDGIAVAGSNLFVAENSSGTIDEFTTGGQNVDTSLISGLSGPSGIAISGSDLFVANTNNGTVGEYTTSGATVNASLISGIGSPQAIAVSGSDLFVSDYFAGTIGEYTTSGATINANLISGVSALGITVSGSDLFVTGYDGNVGSYVIGEYTTSGATINAALISGLSVPSGIVVTGDVSNSELVFDQQPASTTTTSVLAPIKVDIKDANGNILVNDDSNITLAIGSGPSGSILSGTTTVAAVNGVATFSDLSIATAGDNYTLTATDGGDTPATSTSFTINIPGTPGGGSPQAVIAQQTRGAVAGTKLSSMVVDLENADGSLAIDSHSKVSLIIASGPSGGKLIGGIVAKAINGVATFNHLSLKKAGNYTLEATAANFISGQSAPVTITPAAVKKVLFNPAPGSVTHAMPFNVEVELLDAYGNLADGDTITLSLQSHPKNSTLDGNLTATANSGSANFVGLTLDDIGKYSLRASDGKLKATSKKFSAT